MLRHWLLETCFFLHARTQVDGPIACHNDPENKTALFWCRACCAAGCSTPPLEKKFLLQTENKCGGMLVATAKMGRTRGTLVATAKIGRARKLRDRSHAATALKLLPQKTNTRARRAHVLATNQTHVRWDACHHRKIMKEKERSRESNTLIVIVKPSHLPKSLARDMHTLHRHGQHDCHSPQAAD